MERNQNKEYIFLTPGKTTLYIFQTFYHLIYLSIYQVNNAIIVAVIKTSCMITFDGRGKHYLDSPLTTSIPFYKIKN